MRPNSQPRARATAASVGDAWSPPQDATLIMQVGLLLLLIALQCESLHPVKVTADKCSVRHPLVVCVASC